MLTGVFPPAPQQVCDQIGSLLHACLSGGLHKRLTQQSDVREVNGWPEVWEVLSTTPVQFFEVNLQAAMPCSVLLEAGGPAQQIDQDGDGAGVLKAQCQRWLTEMHQNYLFVQLHDRSGGE